MVGRKYFGQDIIVNVGTFINGQGYYGLMPGDRFTVIVSYSGNWVAISKQQTGKSSLFKHMAVQVANQGRCFFIADYAGEWARHVTKMNFDTSEYGGIPMSMPDTIIINEYSIPLSAADEIGDFISLGFTEQAAFALNFLIYNTKELHQDDPEVFQSKVLRKYPTKDAELEDFNKEFEKYGIHLDVPMHSETYHSMIRRWECIKGWFHLGKNLRQKINEQIPLDFDELKKVWLAHQILIVDLSAEKIDEDTNERIKEGDDNKARFVSGLVLRKIRSLHRIKHPICVFEEAGALLPDLDPDLGPFLPTSLQEIYALMTKYPKDMVCVWLICQNEDQLYCKAREQINVKLIGNADGTGEEYQVAKDNRFIKELGVREFLWWVNRHRWAKIKPDFACCEVKHF